MAEREVTSILKTKSGDILALCNPAQDWASRSKRGVISDIENGNHSYYIKLDKKRINLAVEISGKEKLIIARGLDSEHNLLFIMPDDIISRKRVHFER